MVFKGSYEAYLELLKEGTSRTEALSTATELLWHDLSSGAKFTIAASAIGAIIAVVQAVKRHQEELLQTVQANSEAYSDGTASIKDYQKETDSLIKSIESGTLSSEEMYEARLRLSEIEKELTAEFGSTATASMFTGEIEGLSLLTANLEQAVVAYQNLAEAKANQFLNQNGDQLDAANIAMLSEQIYEIGGFNWGEMSDQAKNMFKAIAAEIDGVEFDTRPDPVTDAEEAILRVTDTAANAVPILEKVGAKIREFKTLLYADGINVDDWVIAGKDIDKEISGAIANANETVETYGKQHQEYINATITANKEYRESLEGLQDAEEQYANAVYGIYDSDEDRVKSIQSALNVAQSATDAYENIAVKMPESDAAVKAFIDQTYASLQQHEKQLQLELKIATSVDEGGIVEDADGVMQAIKRNIEKFRGKDESIWSADILSAGIDFKEWKGLPISELDEFQRAYMGLYNTFSNYGLSVPEGLSILHEYGLVIGTTSQQLGDAQRAFSSFSSETEVINNALKSQANGNSVSLEQYEALIKANSEYATCLESNAGVLMFNADAVQKVNEKKRQEQEQIIATNKAYAQMRYAEVAAELTAQRNALADLEIEGRGNVSSIEDQIDALEAEGMELLDAINKYNLMAAAIREATSARAAWINSKDDQQPGDSFSDAADAYSHLWEVLNGSTATRGDTGTSMYKSALNYLIPTDKIKAGEQAIRKYMRSLQEILKIDGKGNISDIRIDNILKKLTQGEDAIFTKDKAGNYFAKEGKTLDEFAAKLGVTKDLARDIIGMLNRNGMNINIEDDEMESYVKKLDDAKNAQKELSESGLGDIKLDFSDAADVKEQIDGINKSIEEASGITAKYGADTTEFQAAADIIDYLIEQKKLLEYDTVLGVDTSKLDGVTKEVFEAVDDFINKKAALDKAVETYGKDSTKAKEAKTALEESIKALQNIDGDGANILKSLGITPESILSSFGVDKIAENISTALKGVTDKILLDEIGIAREAIYGLGEAATTLEDKDVTIDLTVNGLPTLVAALGAYNNLIDKKVTVTVEKEDGEEDANITPQLSGALSGSLSATKDAIAGVVADIEKIKNANANITFNVTGEEDLANAVENAGKLSDTSANVTINVTGKDDLSSTLDDYKKLIDKAISVSVDTTTNGTEDVQQVIQDIQTAITDAEDLAIKLNIDSSDGQAAIEVINQLIDAKTLLEYNAILSIDTSMFDGEVADAIDLMQDFIMKKADLDRACSKTVTFGGISGIEEAKAEIEALVDAISEIDPDILEGLQIDADNLNVDSIAEALSGLTIEDLQISFNIPTEALSSALQQYEQLRNKSIRVTISVLGTEGLISALAYYNSLQDKTVTITIVTERKTVNANGSGGEGDLNGTAHVSGTARLLGTAKVGGDWGTAKPGRTLVGELGREIIVDPNTGRWYTVGDNGAEFVDMPGGAIVFNHIQTRHLLDNGYVTSRGRAMAEGTAAASIITGGGRPSDSAMSGGYSGGSYGGSGSNKNYGSGSKSKEKSAFEKEYDRWNHLLNMEQAHLREYLDWLDSAYQQAYAAGQIEVEDFYKYQEEVYEKQKELFEDSLTDAEHQILGLGRADGNEAQIINIYLDMIKSLENRISEAKAYGLNENDEYIQELTEKIYDYQDEIKDIQEDSLDAAKDAIKDLVDYRIDMLEQDLKNEKDALKDKLSELKDFYGKQKDLLDDARDEEKYLEEQSEKRKAKEDIEKELMRLDLDNSAWAEKRKLELKEELAEAEKDLTDFEKDRTLDKAKEMLDDLYERQEKQFDSQIEAIEKKLDDPHALYNQALADIQNNTLGLYEEMVEYNNKYKTGNPEDVTEMWNEAKESLDKYLSTFGEAYKNIILTPLPDGYASGTASATPGVHEVDEVGPEYVFTSSNGARYRVFSGGEKVLNAKATNFLYGFANTGEKILSTIFDKIISSHASNQISAANHVSEINMGDIIIQGSATESTVSEIRRAKRDEMQWILKEFNKMNKRS